MKNKIAALFLACFATTTVVAADAQDANNAMPPPEQGLMQTFVLIGVGLVCFYFILWRPEQKRRKAQETQRAALKKGDKVSTIAGIVGTVTKISDDIITVRMSDGAKLDFLKGAISDVVAATDEDVKKLEKDE
jgi:preprotein translocase subunit YajC